MNVRLTRTNLPAVVLALFAGAAELVWLQAWRVRDRLARR